jgi:hypothetical protein
MGMEMLLAGLAMTLMGLAVSGLLFAAATRDRSGEAASTAPAEALQPAPSTFFAEQKLDAPPVPVEVLLLQIESHVRMEQAAVESFLAMPSVETLHTKTLSPLVH